MAALAPQSGRRPHRRAHRLPGRRASRPRPRRWSRSSARPGAGSGCWPSTRPRRSPGAPCSATGSGCRSTPPTRRCSSARWPPAATWAGWPRRPRRRCASWTRPAATRCSSRPWASGSREVEVASEADTTIVLLAPGMGDGIQAAKAGILEVGDIFVVNKADRDGADSTARELRHMISLGPRAGAGAWKPPVLKVIATRGEGLRRAGAAIDGHRALAGVLGHAAAARRRHAGPARRSRGSPWPRCRPGSPASAATVPSTGSPTTSPPGAPTPSPPPTGSSPRSPAEPCAVLGRPCGHADEYRDLHEQP